VHGQDMTFKLSEASEEVKKIFEERTSQHKAQIKQDNQTMRDKQARMEEEKNRKTYLAEKDIFE